MARQPCGLAGSSSGAAQTASSWSRASTGSIATIGRSRRSSRSSPKGWRATRSASSRVSGWKRSGISNLWIAISEKLRGAKGSPRRSTTFAVMRGGRPAFSASTRSPASAPPVSDTIISRRSFLSTLVSQKRPASSRSTPSTCSEAGAMVFMTCAIQPPPASSVRASTRWPMPRLPRLRSRMRRRGMGTPSASQRSGWPQTLPPSSTSTTRNTVTLGSPPILWKARPGALSISPSSAISLSSAFSPIFSCAERPKARAISRLPAGWSDCSMKARICSRVGRPGWGFFMTWR